MMPPKATGPLVSMSGSVLGECHERKVGRLLSSTSTACHAATLHANDPNWPVPLRDGSAAHLHGLALVLHAQTPIVIGQTFAQAIISREMQAGRFEIRTDEPGIRVSWQVTGIRQDAWANENRIVIEEDKRAEQRGLYLHPTAFSLSREQGVD